MANNNGLVVNVTILKSTRVVQLAAFNVPCIFGASGRVSVPTLYVDSADMLEANGGPFMDSDPEYIEAAALMSQSITPAKFLVAPNTPSVAQVDTFAVGTLTVSHQYKFTMGTTVISYTSAPSGDTQQVILAALLAAIGTAFPTNPPVTGAVTGSGAGALLTLTASVAGVGVSYSAIDGSLTHVAVTPNHSIATDIATAQQAAPADTPFYGVIVCSHVKGDILQVAAYIETQLLVYVTATLDSAVLTNAAGNVMATLKALSYDRTMIMYSAQANTNGPDGAWMGYMLPTTPGVGNWAMKTLNGVAADNLTPTQISNIVGNNGNVYITLGGNGTTLYGITAGGEYLDVTIFLDWLSSTIQSGIIAVETDPLNLKIPYTNQGIAMLESPVRTTLQTGQNNNGLVPGWEVFAPNANDVPSADRANRELNGLGFTAQLAGAINTINITGYVSA